MKIKKTSLLIFICCFLVSAYTYADQDFKDGISIKGDWMYIEGAPFFINAVGYAGWRPGQWPGTDNVPLRLVDLDFKRIKEAHFNTIRTWEALTPAELDIARKYGLKVVQGIWIDPSHDFSDPLFQKKVLAKIKKVAQWSKDYDNVVMYLIATEPKQQAVLYAGVNETEEFFKKAKEVIQNIDFKPVSMDSWIPLGFMSHDIFDVSVFNIFKFVPWCINKAIGFRSYVKWIKAHHARNKPLFIGETGGFSVSNNVQNDVGFGGNTFEQQAQGNIESITDSIKAGATGVCTVALFDTWHYPSDPQTHDDQPWEWDGLIEFKDKNDDVGIPRPGYFALQKFNQRLNVNGYVDSIKSPYTIKISHSFNKKASSLIINIKLSSSSPDALLERKILIGVFQPIPWIQDFQKISLDKKGRGRAVFKLGNIISPQYVIIAAGYEYKGRQYGDMTMVYFKDHVKGVSRQEKWIYFNKDFPANNFVASGWVGDVEDLTLKEVENDNCYSGDSCLQITYHPGRKSQQGWAGIYWLNSLNDWTDVENAYDLSKYRYLTLWAKGDQGGEKVSEFGVGGRQPNSDDVFIVNTVLSNHWRQYRIPLTGKNLDKILYGFRVFFIKDSVSKSVKIYLDNIKFE